MWKQRLNEQFEIILEDSKESIELKIVHICLFDNYGRRLWLFMINLSSTVTAASAIWNSMSVQEFINFQNSYATCDPMQDYPR